MRQWVELKDGISLILEQIIQIFVNNQLIERIWSKEWFIHELDTTFLINTQWINRLDVKIFSE